jgi:hypothetical protein
MGMDKLMEMLKTILDNNQAKADANTKEIKEKMKTNQAKADGNMKTMQGEMNANNKRMLAEMTETMQEKMDANQVKADANRKPDQDMLARMEAGRKSDIENLKSWMERMMDTDETDVKPQELTETVETTHRECEEPTSADTMACQEKTEVHLEEEELTSVEMKPEVAHEEVPMEDVAVMPVGGRRKQCRGRKQAAG